MALSVKNIENGINEFRRKKRSQEEEKIGE